MAAVAPEFIRYNPFFENSPLIPRVLSGMPAGMTAAVDAVGLALDEMAALIGLRHGRRTRFTVARHLKGPPRGDIPADVAARLRPYQGNRVRHKLGKAARQEAMQDILHCRGPFRRGRMYFDDRGRPASVLSQVREAAQDEMVAHLERLAEVAAGWDLHLGIARPFWYMPSCSWILELCVGPAMSVTAACNKAAARS